MEKIIEIPIEYKRLFDDDWREAAVYGGRYSLKSHTVARVLLVKARAQKRRVACFREYQNSIADSSHQLLVDLIRLYELNDFRVTDKSIINTINGSDFIFKGLHLNEQNVKSTEGIDIAWVEEAQTVSNSSLEILTPTVRKDGSQIIYTYNRLLEEDPVHTRLVLQGRPNTIIINANYHIAEKYGWMPDIIKDEIESDKKNRPSLYKHKWLGEPMGQDAKIYKDWSVIPEIPEEARLERRGLDFGYSDDPNALIDVYRLNNSLILDERLYRKGMGNKLLADFINMLGEQVTIYADSASPKDIDELAEYGIDIAASFKGPGSVNAGIKYIQEQQIFVTSRSVNLLREYRNYMWDFDKDGRQLAKPMELDDHLLDATRYALESYYIHNRDSKLLSPALAVPESKTTPYYGHDGVIEAAGFDIGKILNNNEHRTWKDI